jgi:alginate O-acetyltransferase complex protein AlgI
MQVSSGMFALLVLLALIVYYLLPRRAQNYWLLAVSYIFAVSWTWQAALVLLLVTTINYAIARRMRVNGQGRKDLLWSAIGINLLALVIFRVGSFFVPDLEELLRGFGLVTELGVIQILLPVGLSFYILENIAYQVDVYRGRTQASDNFIDYALYQAYFPKLLAGPIERAGTFLPKLAQPRVVDNEIMARSFTLIAAGVFRKVLIADALTAMIPWNFYEAPRDLGALELWGWLFVFGFALYNDFAGYTSIVRGVSGLFGIELSLNFRQPYFARSFSEFWNGWHMTLSHWLRDYIYFPLLRSLLRRKRTGTQIASLVVPPLVTMLVSGLWHGFSLHMLVWGGLHGLYLVGEQVLARRGPVTAPDQQPRWKQSLSNGVVLVLVMFAWVPFPL